MNELDFDSGMYDAAHDQREHPNEGYGAEPLLFIEQANIETFVSDDIGVRIFREADQCPVRLRIQDEEGRKVESWMTCGEATMLAKALTDAAEWAEQAGLQADVTG